MTSAFFTLGPYKLHYLRFGTGPRLVLAFHGYSNSAGMFASFESYLSEEFTVLSIDLPHHGGSTDWTAGHALEPRQLAGLVHRLCDEHGVEKVSLLGFSLGGRVSFKIMEMIPQRVERAVLAAPDGLRFNPFYFFVTRTHTGRKLFGDVLSRPTRFFRMLDALKRRGVLHEARYSFAKYFLESSHARDFLGKAWPALRHLIPRTAAVRRAIAAHNIPVHIFAGRYDRVIPLASAAAFARGVPQVQLHVVEKSHRVIDSETVPVMARALLE